MMLSRFLHRFCYRFARPQFKSRTNDNSAELSWLEDLKSPEVQEYIKQENRYTKLQLLRTWHVQRQIKKRINKLERIEHHYSESIDNEEKIGCYAYYQKQTSDGLPSIYRKHVHSGHETLVLNQNDVARETGFIQILGLKVSSCSKYLAAILKTGVSDASCLCHVYRITNSGSVLIEKLHSVKNAEWSNNTWLITTVCDDFGVPREVRKYCIQERKSYSLLKEKDPRFQFDILKSRDGRFILAHSNSKNCSEVYFMDASKIDCGFQCLLEREDKVECFTDHWGDHFYALKNNRNNNDYKGIDRCHLNYHLSLVFTFIYAFANQISKTSLDDSPRSWHTVYSAVKQSSILDMEILSDCIVAHEMNNLIPQLTLIPLDDQRETQIFKALDHPSTVESFSNHNPHCESVRCAVSSPISPLQVLELSRANLKTVQISRFPSEWNSADFEWQTVQAKSQDGTIVPTTIYYHKRLKDFENAPLFMAVYGAYGIPADLRFSAVNAFLLENDWILAFPHVRGGGEFGRTWYKQATRQSKKKTYEDVAASLVSMHNSGISNPSKTVIFGASAGGMAAAVICNQMPHLLKAAVLQVPFVDVLDSMVKGNSYLTSQEYEEWGNPTLSKCDYNTIASYCPLHNLRSTENFPSIFIKTYIDDDRVPAWMPLKFVAKWRSLEMTRPKLDSQVLCRINENGGHYGYGNEQSCESASEMLAFLYMTLGLKLNS